MNNIPTTRVYVISEDGIFKVVRQLETDQTPISYGDFLPEDLEQLTPVFEKLLDVFLKNLSKRTVTRSIIRTREDRERLLATPLEEIEAMDVRTYNCLKAGKVNTLGELVVKSRTWVMNLRKFGKKSMARLEGNILDSRGLRLGMNVEHYIETGELVTL